MESTLYRALPGGSALRSAPAGLSSGATLSRIDDVEGAFGLVALDLALAERALKQLVMSEVAAVPAVAGYLVDAGGKRLRPALTALGARTLGVEGPMPGLMCVGELIHLGSLLHDDVVDEGQMRRGQPAAHRVFGSAVTVLTGDFCLARAVLLAAEEGGHAAVTALAAAVTEMAEGEVLQLQRAGDLYLDRDGYFEVVDKKSAALIAWCSAAAAWAVDDAHAAVALQQFGRGVGVAFQITDDVLDYRTGTGKPAGADLRQRKMTLPLLYALDAVDGLRDEMSAGDPDDLQVARWVDRIAASGALEQALDDARDRVELALRALDSLPAGDGRDAMAVLGRHLVERVR